jgi:hypothetical protein
MLFPVRLVRGGLPPKLESRVKRFVWTDPKLLLDPDVSSEDFRKAMNAVYVGGTFKITGAGRHPSADELLTNNVDVSQSVIVDIGASDGSTSLDLISRLPGFGSYIIADLFLNIQAQRVKGKILFFDPSNICILVVSRRLLAWPSMSRLVHLLYRRSIKAAGRGGADRVDVLLLNPEVRRLMADDARISYQVHDVFTTWEGPTPDVIKVANLLRRLYFSDDQISRALAAIKCSLPEGGHLLIVDNAREKGIDTRAGLYQRQGDRFVLVESTPHDPEIGDLVLASRGEITASPAS